jgi:hypothetical protein
MFSAGRLGELRRVPSPRRVEPFISESEPSFSSSSSCSSCWRSVASTAIARVGEKRHRGISATACCRPPVTSVMSARPLFQLPGAEHGHGARAVPNRRCRTRSWCPRCSKSPVPNAVVVPPLFQIAGAERGRGAGAVPRATARCPAPRSADGGRDRAAVPRLGMLWRWGPARRAHPGWPSRRRAGAEGCLPRLRPSRR